MQTYTAAQMRAAEAPYLAAGVPLMARAAAALAAEIIRLLPSGGALLGVPVLVLTGPGNNGGDALHAAAILGRHGALITVVPTAERMHPAGLADARSVGAVVAGLDLPAADLRAAAAASVVIIDGILGTGATANPALRGRAREVVAQILPVLSGPSAPLVVAVDLPSGIGADDGAVPDPTVLPADLTVTFGGCKAGLLREPGAQLVGRLVVADIGIGEELARVTAGAANSAAPVDRADFG